VGKTQVRAKRVRQDCLENFAELRSRADRKAGQEWKNAPADAGFFSTLEVMR
jgi:hypothetical protein